MVLPLCPSLPGRLRCRLGGNTTDVGTQENRGVDHEQQVRVHHHIMNTRDEHEKTMQELRQMARELEEKEQRNKKPSRILLVDDDQPLHEVMDYHFKEFSRRTLLHATSGEEAIPMLESDQTIDVVLLDLNLGHGMDGIEVFRMIRAIDPKKPIVIFFTGYAQDPRLDVVPSIGWAVVASKPVSMDELEDIITIVMGEKK